MLDPVIVNANVVQVKKDLDQLRSDFQLLHGPVDVLRYLVTHTWSAGEFNTWLSNATNYSNFQRILTSPEGAATIASSMTAMTAIANNAVAVRLAADNYLALQSWMSNAISVSALFNSDIALDVLLAREGAVNLLTSTYTSMMAAINSQTALNKIRANPGIFEQFTSSVAVPLASVPTMTSATTPSGVASASSFASESYAAYKVFSTSTGWRSAIGQKNDQWLAYEFSEPVFIAKVLISQNIYSTTADVIVGFRVESSRDGSNWDVLHTGNAPSNTTSPLSTTFNLSGVIAERRKHYRLYITGFASSGGNSVTLRQLNFRGFQ